MTTRSRLVVSTLLAACWLVVGCVPLQAEPEPAVPLTCLDACVVDRGGEEICDKECEHRIECNDIVNAICEAYSEPCGGGFNDCKNAFLELYECANAQGIGAAADTCKEDVGRVTLCSEDLPAACLSLVTVGDRSVPVPCGSLLATKDCPANSAPFCGGQLGSPTCECDDGFFRDGDAPDSVACEETCQHELDRVGSDVCVRNFGENFEGTCAGRQIDEPFICDCADGFLLIDGVAGAAEGELACIRDVCVDLAPFFVCRDPLGEPEPNCSCDCRNADLATDRPECFCNAGFRLSQGRCVPE